LDAIRADVECDRKKDNARLQGDQITRKTTVPPPRTFRGGEGDKRKKGESGKLAARLEKLSAATNYSRLLNRIKKRNTGPIAFPSL